MNIYIYRKKKYEIHQFLKQLNLGNLYSIQLNYEGNLL